MKLPNGLLLAEFQVTLVVQGSGLRELELPDSKLAVGWEVDLGDDGVDLAVGVVEGKDVVT